MRQNKIKEVEGILDDNGYDYSEFSGCFDIAASKNNENARSSASRMVQNAMHSENILLLKVLENVDSFMEDQAKNLSILADDIDANAMLVGSKTRVEKLKDNVIYERFGVNTVTANTFELIIDGNVPKVCRFRGGFFSEINPEKLRDARNAIGLTQEELAKHAGVTKKNIYEHEARQMKIQFKIAQKLESVLDEDLMEPISLTSNSVSYNIARGGFEKSVSSDMKKLGLKTDIVYKTPFNIIAKLDTRGSVNSSLIISDAEASAERAKRNAPHVANFANITKKFSLAITKDEVSLDIPSVTEQQLKKMHPGDIRKLLE